MVMLAGQCGSDGEDALFRGGEEPVDHDADERRVEAVLDRKVSQLGVGHRLRHDDGADGDAGDHVAREPDPVVVADPLQERQQALGKGEGVAAGRDVGLEEAARRRQRLVVDFVIVERVPAPSARRRAETTHLEATLSPRVTASLRS